MLGSADDSEVAPLATEMLSFATWAIGEVLLRQEPPYQLPLVLGLSGVALDGSICVLSLLSDRGLFSIVSLVSLDVGSEPVLIGEGRSG